ncbi:MAG: hypothetical protein IT578_00225 [Verrucomicrobiae bacterium]|nr:hypothetical protein [Verrucomicrobiae bacterium]
MKLGFVQKKLKKAGGIFPFFLILMVGLLLTTGCAAPTSFRKGASRYREIPVPAGLRISKQGEVVAELDSSPDLLFEQVSQRLRREYRITFINSTIRQIEGEDRASRVAVRITPLLTGKTGVTVLVKRKDLEEPDPMKAVEIAAALLPVGVRTGTPALR